MPSARIRANELFLADAKRALTPPARAPRATLMSLVDDMLTIRRGEKKLDKKDENENENYHFVERSYGTFSHSLRLPYSVDTDKIRAYFTHGDAARVQRQEKSGKIQVQCGRPPGSPPPSVQSQQHANERPRGNGSNK